MQMLPIHKSQEFWLSKDKVSCCLSRLFSNKKRRHTAVHQNNCGKQYCMYNQYSDYNYQWKEHCMYFKAIDTTLIMM